MASCRFPSQSAGPSSKGMRSDRLAAAGVTWEALAGWLQGPMDKAAWEAIIPSMGVMALARNLRNFDEAGVSDDGRRPDLRTVHRPGPQ
jgi:hypothetical protein